MTDVFQTTKVLLFASNESAEKVNVYSAISDNCLDNFKMHLSLVVVDQWW